MQVELFSWCLFGFLILALIVLAVRLRRFRKDLVDLREDLVDLRDQWSNISRKRNDDIDKLYVLIKNHSDAVAGQLSYMNRRVDLWESKGSNPRKEVRVPDSNSTVAQWVGFFKGKIGHYARSDRASVLSRWRGGKYKGNEAARAALLILITHYKKF